MVTIVTKMIGFMSNGKNCSPTTCSAVVFSFANVNKRASAGGEILAVAPKEKGGLVCWRETTPRVYARQPPHV